MITVGNTQGPVTAPAAGALLADLGIIAPLLPTINVDVTIGMTGTAESKTTNVQLQWSNGDNIVVLPSLPGTQRVNVANYPVPSDGSTHVEIKAVANGTAGAIYTVVAFANASGVNPV